MDKDLLGENGDNMETSRGPSRRGFLLGSLASFLGMSFLGACARRPMKSAHNALPLGAIAPWETKAGFFPVHAAAGIADITPSKPIRLAGYNLRKGGRHGGVYEPIRAKVLVLDDSSTKLAIITGDIVGWPRPIIDAVRKHLLDKYGMQPAQILINASHNHEGPEFRDPTYPEYTGEVQAKVLALLDDCFARTKPARIFFGRGQCHIGVNRRLPDRFGYVIMRINRYGVTDPELNVLKVVGTDGKPIAVLTNYACHLTTTATFQIGGDYAGVGLRMLEDEMPGTVALFMQGAAGDIKPNVPRKDNPLEFDRHMDDGPETVRQLATVYKNSVKRVLAQPMEDITGAIDCRMEVVQLPLMAKTFDAIGEPPFDGPTRKWVRMAKLILDAVDQDGNYKKTRDCEVYVTRIGNGMGERIGSKFVLVAMNGEVCCPFGLRIKSQLPNNSVAVAAYTGPGIGYVLGAQELSGKGYEGRTPYSPDHEDVLVCKVMDMVLGPPPEM
ncbi:neutral/alkaline non-lysosomal ceramidase N-terminal domain-containing protein [bacterium]|nr:neutral/alkaline non-lysosomal ceramidase N-terminal domain-containing protein [bacterium]